MVTWRNRSNCRYWFGLSTSLVITVVSLLFISPEGFALDPNTMSSEGSTGTSVPTFTTQLPTQFGLSQVQGLNGMFTQCVNPALQGGSQQLQDALGQVFGAGGASSSGLPNSIAGLGGGMGAGGQCLGSDTVQDSMGMDCMMFSDGRGGFSTAGVDAMMNQIKKVQTTISCKQGKISALSAQLSCMQGQADALTTQIQSLQQVLQQNLSKFQSDVSTIDATINDRKAQAADVAQRLGGGATGDNASGSGLLGMQATMNKALADASTTIQTLNNQINGKGPDSLYQKYQGLTIYAQGRKTALAQDCFANQVGNGLQCQVNGGACTPQQYALNRYYQNQFVINGQRVINDTTRNMALSKQNQLQSALAAIFQEAATFSGMQNAAQNPASAATQVQNSFSLTDLLNRIQLYVGPYDGNGLNLSGFVRQEVQNCYLHAQTTVDAEETRVGTAYYTQYSAVKQAEGDLKNQMSNTLLPTYTQLYSQAMAALTLQHDPLPLDACKAASVQNEFKCITDIQTKLQNLLLGNTADTQVMINVPASSNPALAINFTCSGINGCITAYQQVQKNLVNEGNRLGNFRTQYVTQANSQIDQFMTQMKTMLSPQSQMIKSMMTQLNMQLAQVGVAPINATPITAEQMQKDTDGQPPTGLYKMPQSLLAVIGGGMAPPMIDMSSANFNQGLAAVGQAQQDLNAKSSQVTAALTNLTRVAASCRRQLAQSNLDRVRRSVGEVTSMCTGLPPGACAKNNFDELMYAVQGLQSSASLTGSLATLSNPMCDDTSGNIHTDADIKGQEAVLKALQEKTPRDDVAIQNQVAKVEEWRRALSGASRKVNLCVQATTNAKGDAESAAKALTGSDGGSAE